MNKLEEWTNTIQCIDCLEGMKKLPDGCVDLVVTDPPYGINKDFANDDLSKEEYLIWCKSWIMEASRILKYGGSFWITLGWQYVAEIKCLFDGVEKLKLRNWIIWYRQDGWKGDSGFAHSYEHILYFIKQARADYELKMFGEYIKQKRKEKNLTTKKCRESIGLTVYSSCGNAGFLWIETGRIPRADEYQKIKTLLDLDDRYDEFIGRDITFNKVDEYNDLWLTPKSEKDRTGHPTQKPLSLMERIILASSKENDLILDPFAGSGTTLVACKQLNRRFIGFEISEEYVKIARERLKQEVFSLSPNT